MQFDKIVKPSMTPINVVSPTASVESVKVSVEINHSPVPQRTPGFVNVEDTSLTTGDVSEVMYKRKKETSKRFKEGISKMLQSRSRPTPPEKADVALETEESSENETPLAPTGHSEEEESTPRDELEYETPGQEEGPSPYTSSSEEGFMSQGPITSPLRRSRNNTNILSPPRILVPLSDPNGKSERSFIEVSIDEYDSESDSSQSSRCQDHSYSQDPIESDIPADNEDFAHFGLTEHFRDMSHLHADSDDLERFHSTPVRNPKERKIPSKTMIEQQEQRRESLDHNLNLSTSQDHAEEANASP